MEKVCGIGGVFFRSKSPEALAMWYRDHLGIDTVPDDYDTRPWTQQAGVCVFAPFTEQTEYLGEPQNRFMLNFRVRDLAAICAQLEAAGIRVAPDPESPHPNGSFAWITDPEGNRVELWEPAGACA